MRRTLIFLALVLSASISAIGQANNEKAAVQPRMISVGDRRIAVYCDGPAVRSPTIILIPGGGRPAQDWEKVQPAVASFVRVCSYDPFNIGASDRARDGSDSQTNRMTEEQFAAWDRIWRGFQEDLAKRSTHGKLRIAEKSGHFNQLDQPELVIQAIRDLIRTH